MRRLPLIATVALILTATVGAAAADDGKKSSWAETMTAARAAYLQSPEAKQAAASDSLFKPFDSGPLDGNGPAKQVVVNVAGLKELRLVAICERGPANCNIWGEPKLIAKDGTVTKLTDLKPTSVSVGWGQLLVNKNWKDHPLIVGDRQFEFGFWVHANSELTFALDGKYERFEALVGEDKDRLGGLVRFKVLSTPVPLPACLGGRGPRLPAAGRLAAHGRRGRRTGGVVRPTRDRRARTGDPRHGVAGSRGRFAAACRTRRPGRGEGRRRRRPLARPVRPRLPASRLRRDAENAGERGGESGLGEGTRRARGRARRRPRTRGGTNCGPAPCRPGNSIISSRRCNSTSSSGRSSTRPRANGPGTAPPTFPRNVRPPRKSPSRRSTARRWCSTATAIRPTSCCGGRRRCWPT